MTLFIIALYLAAVVAIGLAASRLLSATGEDYFVATRTIGPFLLLMSLFGTHMTAFSLLGASGEAYRRGIGVFALMASSSALVVPVVFLFVGAPVWQVGKRFGFLTQAQYLGARWGSPGLGLLLFAVLVALVVPYLLIGVLGGGLTVEQITGGTVPRWLGSLVLTAVVLVYVTAAGLRGTAWVNTFQTLVFMTLGGVAVGWIVHRLGGLDTALARLAAERPDLLARGDHVRPLELLSYTLIPLSAGTFPHLFQHWLSARSERAFRLPVTAYPLCIAVVWLPSVLLGVLGRLDFPDLQGPAASSILIRLFHLHAPEALAGLLAAGVLAAVMSSLDSQVLALGTMFTQDVVRPLGFHDRMSERAQVLAGRLFVAGILLVTYLLSLIANTTIFGLAVWAFTGFAALLPVVLAALYWRRSTRQGAAAAVVTTAVLWSYFFLGGGGTAADGTLAGSGLLPVAVLLPASAAVLVVVSLLTPPPPAAVVERFFPSPR